MEILIGLIVIGVIIYWLIAAICGLIVSAFVWTLCTILVIVIWTIPVYILIKNGLYFLGVSIAFLLPVMVICKIAVWVAPDLPQWTIGLSVAVLWPIISYILTPILFETKLETVSSILTPDFFEDTYHPAEIGWQKMRLTFKRHKIQRYNNVLMYRRKR